MSDALENGRRNQVLNVIDDFWRECLAAVVDTSNNGVRVARELDRVAELRGYLCMAFSDNGAELTSSAALKWQEDRKIGWHERTSAPVFTSSLPHGAPTTIKTGLTPVSLALRLTNILTGQRKTRT